MKAKLILRVEDYVDELGDKPLLILSLFPSDRKEFHLCKALVSSNDAELYIEKLEDFINEATLVLNSIPGLKLHIDNTVYEFIDDDDDEKVRKSINQLMVEI